jgi:hypothetical protein
VDITLVGADATIMPVREVTSDLLSRDGVTVSWRKAERLRIDDVVEARISERNASVVVWVDISSVSEARIYFRAAAGQRFVIRRVSLAASGGGPLAAEEIAQIIQSVRRALASDASWALTLSEARVALSVPEQRPPPASPPAVRVTEIEVGSAAIGQLHAPGLPVSGDLGVSIAALSRAPSVPAGSLGARLVLAYGLPAHFASGAVGADLRTAKLRLQLVWEPWQHGRLALRLGFGGGADRVTYAPTAELPGATAAASDSFFVGLARADAALHFEVSQRFALAAALLAEIALQRVHYDAYDSDGARRAVLVPYRVRPGVAIGLEVRL